MGSTVHNSQATAQYVASKKASGQANFNYNQSVKSGQAQGIHPMLDPAYGGIRVSDPPSPDVEVGTATILWDGTGSNIDVVEAVYPEMPKIADLLALKGWAGGHVNLQMGVIGDARRQSPDPLQISQFESDGESILKYIEKIYLEGWGGGNRHESYDLAFWHLVHGNRLDVWKRGGKGVVVVVFDEMIYDYVDPNDLRLVYAANGDADNSDGSLTPGAMRKTLESGLVLPREPIAISDLIADVKAKYDVYAVMGNTSQYNGDAEILAQWRGFFGNENVLEVPTELITQMIVGIIGRHNNVPLTTMNEEFTALYGSSTAKALSTTLRTIRSPLAKTDDPSLSRL